MTAPIVDPEFRALLPVLDSQALEGLESDIVANGIRDPLVIWEGHGILLDGHNRLAIATKHGLAYQTVERAFAGRAEAADWIDLNQCSRRNLTPEALSMIRGRRYNRAKKPSGGQRGNAGNRRGRLRPQKEDAVHGQTASRIAAEHGVCASTIERDGKLAAAVEKLAEVDPEIAQKVISGKGPTRRAVIAAAEAGSDGEAKKFLAGEKKPAPIRRAKTLEEQRGHKRQPVRAESDRAASSVVMLETAVEALAGISANALSPFVDRLGAVRARLSKLMRRDGE